MAHIFPIREDLHEVPYSEIKVYDLLESLDDSFTIFHSVQWLKKSNKWKSTWKENDFIILHKELGAIVLEVKGGDIEYYDGVFHQINTSTGEENLLNPKKKNDPLSQAIDGIYHYRRLLDTIAIDLSDRFPIEAGVWFSTCDIKGKIDEFPLKYREASGAVLGKEDFQLGCDAITKIYKFYNNKQKTNITKTEYDKIIRLIASDFDLITAPGVRKEEMDRSFLKLTNEQTGLLDYISEQKHATIQGSAGTGKTLVAKEAAKKFGKEGRKVLFLCFNRFLFLYLKEEFPYENVTYLNIHSFIARYRGNTDTTSSEKRAAQLLKIDWDSIEFDDVIIDEAQDFLNEEILYFKDYMELREGHFFVFYDKNQLITTKVVPEWIVNSECRLILSKNCRNTYEIAITSYNVIDITVNKKEYMINGDQTTISFIKSDLLKKLAKLLGQLTSDKYGYDYSDIVILSLKSENDSILSGVTSISGIPVSNEKTKSSVLFTTASKFKGLESRVIIVVDIDDSCFTSEEKKRIFYVACSRATQKLALILIGDDSQIKYIANSIDPKSHFAPKGKIAMKTQAKIIDLAD